MRISNLVFLTCVSLGVVAACDRNRREGEPEQGLTPQTDPAAPGAEQKVQPAPEQKPAAETTPAAHSPQKGEADLKAAPGTKIDGDAKFEELADGLKIVVEVEDAPPGKKGVHIHDKGDCSDIKGKSMGEHYAPMGEQHGLPGAAQHHIGDLGNIDIDKDGKGKLEIVVGKANLKPNDKMSFLGRAIVVHAGEDVGTGTSGNSGEPIACGVIEKD